jgi:hypothetical protein
MTERNDAAAGAVSEAQSRLWAPRFTSTRQSAEALVAVRPEWSWDLRAADRLAEECEELSHLGSLNRSTLWVSVNT